MLTMQELREIIKTCIEKLDSFSSLELRSSLKNIGYDYKTDYSVITFSNAIASLIRKKYIAPSPDGNRGDYIIVKSNDSSCKNPLYISKSGETFCKNINHNNEPELSEMRTEITDLLNSTIKQIEERVNLEKSSTFINNIVTFNDIAKVTERLRGFEFTIKNN